jgi:hypothetical protein
LSTRFRISWIALALTNLSVLVFGLVVVVLPSAEARYLRAIGAASIGMGIFGTMITLTAFRRRERWAYFTLWYLPLFWTAHLIGNLPPGQDHIHQVVFIILSLAGLLIPFDRFLGRQC